MRSINKINATPNATNILVGGNRVFDVQLARQTTSMPEHRAALAEPLACEPMAASQNVDLRHSLPSQRSQRQSVNGLLANCTSSLRRCLNGLRNEIALMATVHQSIVKSQGTTVFTWEDRITESLATKRQAKRSWPKGMTSPLPSLLKTIFDSLELRNYSSSYLYPNPASTCN